MRSGEGPRGRSRAWCAAVAAAALLAACGERDAGTPVDLSLREKTAAEPAPGGQPLRFAIGGMIVPEEGYAQYAELLKHVGRLLGRPLQIVDRTGYAAISAGLRTGAIDAGFVCSGPYVEGKRDFGLEMIAVPVAYGRSSYNSYIIVHRDSPARSFEDLRGRSFAFTDPQSNTGRLVPVYYLATLGERPETFFSRTTYTGTHDNSILAVTERIIDAAAVDSLIYDYASRTNPRATAGTRILWTSPPYGIPPVVVRPGLDPLLKRRLREVFLGLDRDAEGKAILGRIMVERFVEGRDEDYDSIRAMAAAVASLPSGPAPPERASRP